MKGIVLLAAALLAACAGRPTSGTSSTPASPPSLQGTTWRAVDIPGATLSFPEEGRIAGSGSCNRFFGSVKVEGDSLEISGVGSTKMACPEPIMGQEQKYLQALAGATRYAIEGSTLTIWVKGSDVPLRFTRQEP